MEVTAEQPTLDVGPIESALTGSNTFHNRFDVRCKTRVAGASPVETALAQVCCREWRREEGRERRGEERERRGGRESDVRCKTRGRSLSVGDCTRSGVLP